MINYIGLDFETSGTDPWGDSYPIQLGLSVYSAANAVVGVLGGEDTLILDECYIGASWLIHDPAFADFSWSAESQSIHGFTPEYLKENGAPAWVQDARAVSWLVDRLGHTGRMFNIPVGWNVSGFDRQYITRWFPGLNRLLSYRCADLNTALFLHSDGQEGRYRAMKASLKEQADVAFRSGLMLPDLRSKGGMEAHDAEYDAMTALWMWRTLAAE